MGARATDNACYFGIKAGAGRCREAGKWRYVGWPGASDALLAARYCDEHKSRYSAMTLACRHPMHDNDCPDACARPVEHVCRETVSTVNGAPAAVDCEHRFSAAGVEFEVTSGSGRWTRICMDCAAKALRGLVAVGGGR